MTDDEINYRVAIKQGEVEKEKSFESFVEYKEKTGLNLRFFKDYCNDINAAWPIMLKNNISPMWDSRGPGADHYLKSIDYYNHNVIRAAMIVYLMIGDSDE